MTSSDQVTGNWSQKEAKILNSNEFNIVTAGHNCSLVRSGNWSHLVTSGHNWPHMVTNHNWLHETPGHRPLLVTGHLNSYQVTVTFLGHIWLLVL